MRSLRLQQEAAEVEACPAMRGRGGRRLFSTSTKTAPRYAQSCAPVAGQRTGLRKDKDHPSLFLSFHTFRFFNAYAALSRAQLPTPAPKRVRECRPL